MFKKTTPYFITFIIIQLIIVSVLPTVSFADALDQALYKGPTVTLTGMYETPALSTSVSINIIDNNGASNPATLLPNNKWSYNKTLSDGVYNYTISKTANFLLLLPTTEITPITFTVDGTGPVISITSPAIQKEKIVKINGTVTDTSTTGDKIQMQLLDTNSNQITSATFTGLSSTSNQWSVTVPGEFADGTYQFFIKAIDSLGNTSTTPYSVRIDSSRPKVASVKINLSNTVATTDLYEVDLLSGEEMDYVKKDTSITVNITDNYMLSADKIKNMIMIYSSSGTNITGMTTINKVTDTNYQIVFKPDQLAASTTYYIYINPAYIYLSPGSLATTDTAGNPLYPIIRKFTTERAIDTTNFSEIQKQYFGLSDPHGNFSNTTNTCKNCHSTHVSEGPKLEQPSFDYSTYNYCMACHDGTVAARPENMSQNDHFAEYNNADVKKMATDCSTCHNPHLTWRAENPSLLDDHYVVENHPAVEGYTSDMFDSDKILCESCHEGDSGIVMKYTPKDVNDPIRVNYKVLHYRKVTATGVSDDYALCFRCHDGSRTNITNIKTYYENTNSKHRITAIDGGRLTNSTTPLADGTIPNDGHIPCAECHGTHGSDNLNMLNNKIGHEDRRGFSAPSSLPGGWDAEKQKNFCIKCHNGSSAIYGVVGKKFSETDDNHKNITTETCADCHGGQSKTFKEAAHSPKNRAETLYQQKCSSCHGVDLKGVSGTYPDLTKVGSRLTKDEIEAVIVNGKGTMPNGLLIGYDADAVARWLAERK